jgi:hypothetical protein
MDNGMGLTQAQQAQLVRLRELHARGELRAEQFDELEQLLQLSERGSGWQPLTEADRERLMRLGDRGVRPPLNEADVRRLQQLERRRGNLSPRDQRQLARLYDQRDRMLIQQYWREFQQLQQQRGQQTLTPQQLDRLRRLGPEETWLQDSYNRLQNARPGQRQQLPGPIQSVPGRPNVQAPPQGAQGGQQQGAPAQGGQQQSNPGTQSGTDSSR